eukprot:TRINITY_DN7683_c0_g2_i1.p1 TRINITY_DN7683_c0_g2~~TRINITY_DN7683_c0_g2_i1.p1  ORF type:complete len:909 (-),score=118.15 TRINITY_DN7683_c0_g2_i1:116-2842(-)
MDPMDKDVEEGVANITIENEYLDENNVGMYKIELYELIQKKVVEGFPQAAMVKFLDSINQKYDSKILLDIITNKVHQEKQYLSISEYSEMLSTGLNPKNQTLASIMCCISVDDIKLLELQMKTYRTKGIEFQSGFSYFIKAVAFETCMYPEVFAELLTIIPDELIERLLNVYDTSLLNLLMESMHCPIEYVNILLDVYGRQCKPSLRTTTNVNPVAHALYRGMPAHVIEKIFILCQDTYGIDRLNEVCCYSIRCKDKDAYWEITCHLLEIAIRYGCSADVLDFLLKIQQGPNEWYFDINKVSMNDPTHPTLLMLAIMCDCSAEVVLFLKAKTEEICGISAAYARTLLLMSFQFCAPRAFIEVLIDEWKSIFESANLDLIQLVLYHGKQSFSSAILFNWRFLTNKESINLAQQQRRKLDEAQGTEEIDIDSIPFIRSFLSKPTAPSSKLNNDLSSEICVEGTDVELESSLSNLDWRALVNKAESEDVPIPSDLLSKSYSELGEVARMFRQRKNGNSELCGWLEDMDEILYEMFSKVDPALLLKNIPLGNTKAFTEKYNSHKFNTRKCIQCSTPHSMIWLELLVVFTELPWKYFEMWFESICVLLSKASYSKLSRLLHGANRKKNFPMVKLIATYRANYPEASYNIHFKGCSALLVISLMHEEQFFETAPGGERYSLFPRMCYNQPPEVIDSILSKIKKCDILLPDSIGNTIMHTCATVEVLALLLEKLPLSALLVPNYDGFLALSMILESYSANDWLFWKTFFGQFDIRVLLTKSKNLLNSFDTFFHKNALQPRLNTSYLSMMLQVVMLAEKWEVPVFEIIRPTPVIVLTLNTVIEYLISEELAINLLICEEHDLGIILYEDCCQEMLHWTNLSLSKRADYAISHIDEVDIFATKAFEEHIILRDDDIY